MPITQADLQDFHEFATGRINNGGSEECLEELAYQWQLLRERDDVNADIRQGLADVEAGRGRPAREVCDELAQKYGFRSS